MNHKQDHTLSLIPLVGLNVVVQWVVEKSIIHMMYFAQFVFLGGLKFLFSEG